MTRTNTRVPRMTGCPAQMAGSRTIRCCSVIEASRGLSPILADVGVNDTSAPFSDASARLEPKMPVSATWRRHRSGTSHCANGVHVALLHLLRRLWDRDEAQLSPTPGTTVTKD